MIDFGTVMRRVDGFTLNNDVPEQVKRLYVRRPLVVPISRLSTQEFLDMLPEVHALSGFDGYQKTVTAEPKALPIPHVVEISAQMQRAKDLYFEHIKEFWEYFLPLMRCEPQTIERRSRMGWPYYSFALEGATKRDIAVSTLDSKIFERLLSSSGFTLINKRLQPEPLAKKRLYQFISSENEVLEVECDQRFRELRPDLYGSRVRLVFNYGILNYLTQMVDSTLHDAYLLKASFHHDMTRFPYDTHDPNIMSSEEDIPHYERLLGMLIEERARLIGGRYFEAIKKNLQQPYALKRIDGAVISGTLEPGKTIQLGSGISAVAPLGKEFNAIIYAIAYAQATKTSFTNALDVLMCHKDPDFIVLQFGDDSKRAYRRGRGEKINELVTAFRYDLLHATEEKPPKFLGYKKIQIAGATLNRLSVESCFLNFWLDERAPGTLFRPFANFGFFERRKAYKAYGEPAVMEYLTREKDFLERKGLWLMMYDLAIREKARVGQLPLNYVLNKQYLLTKQERVRLGFDTVIPSDSVRTAIEHTDLFKGKIHV